MGAEEKLRTGAPDARLQRGGTKCLYAPPPAASRCYCCTPLIIAAKSGVKDGALPLTHRLNTLLLLTPSRTGFC
jgi:hypothetical protein